MSNIDKRALREAAERAESDSWGYDRDEFNEALTPSTVLALLDELEAKDKQIGDLKATAAHSNAGWKEAHEQEARAEAAEKRIAELQAPAPELKMAHLINKFYERYPLAEFKSDTERSAALGYFMAGAELQCFGEFINYAELMGDE